MEVSNACNTNQAVKNAQRVDETRSAAATESAQANRTQSADATRSAEASAAVGRTPVDPSTQSATRQRVAATDAMRAPQLQSALPRLQSAIPQLQSAIPQLQSALPQLQSALPQLQSAIPNLQSANGTVRRALQGPVCRPQTPTPSPQSPTTGGLPTPRPAPQSPTPTPQSPTQAPTQNPQSPTQSPQSPTQAPAAPRPDRVLRRGHSGEDVRDVQRRLNAAGASPKLEEDGKFGPKTLEALSKFQRANGLRADGSVGPQTRAALERRAPATTNPRETRPGQTNPTQTNPQETRPAQTNPAQTNPQETRPAQTNPPQTNPTGNPNNNTATIDRTERAGQRNQMVNGRITVNGRTYEFASGGHGRGSLPPGEYTVSNLRNRNTRGMVKDGVGFSADLSDKYNRRVGGTRTALRIHPDGGSAGTMGCIGIKGDAATLRRFQADLRAELARNGGRFTLRVG